MRTSVFAAALFGALIGLGACPVAAEENNGPNPNDGPYPETTLIHELQAAIRASDKDWFVSRMHYPVRYFGETKQIIRSKDWFLKHYDTVISLELKASILAQDPEHFFKNYEGLMVGDGGLNIWFEDFGGPGAGIPTRYEIITINNTDPVGAPPRQQR
jgi:hypothetical protein